MTSARAPGSVLVTDADGTLWSGDVAEDLLALMVAEREVHPEGRAAIADLLDASSRGAATPSSDPLDALIDGLRSGTLDPLTTCRATALALAGSTEEEVRERSRRAQVGLSARLTPEMRGVLAWATHEGVPVWIVSASPRLVVEEALGAAGLHAAGVLGIELTTSRGRLTAPLLEPITLGAGKVTAVRAALPGADVLAAFGDAAPDVSLLLTGRIGCAVRPSPALVARCALEPTCALLVHRGTGPAPPRSPP